MKLSALAVLLPALAAAAEPKLTLASSPVILGRTESVSVLLELDEPPGAADRPLRVAVNVGSFGEVQREAPGRYRCVYVPPPTRFPQVALVAVWREAGPDAPIDFLRIPLHGATKVPVKTRPLAQVTVEVDQQTFGPVAADRNGDAVVLIVVPPGVADAQVTARPPQGPPVVGKTTVDVPPYNRLTAALVPHAIAADGRSSARLEVFYDLGGADLPPDQVQVDSSLGKPAFERAERGRYVYRYRPPAGSTAREVKFEVSVRGDASAKAQVALQLGLPAPARAVIRAPDVALAADGRSSGTVRALVFDEKGMGQGAQQVTLLADGQPLPVVDTGGGIYEAQWRAPAVYPRGGVVHFQLEVGALRDAVIYQLKAGAAPRDVIAHFEPSPVPADGKTAAKLVVEVKDAAGAPLSVRLLGSATGGTLGPFEQVSEGTYQAQYVGPNGGDAEVKLMDESGHIDRSIRVPLREPPALLQLGARVAFNHSLRTTYGPRFGADLWSALGRFRLGLVVTYGFASQSVADAGATLTAKSEVHLVPLMLRAGFEVLASGAFAAVLGLGGGLVVARYSSSLSTDAVTAVGGGGLGFGAISASLGPGRAFFELSYSYLPVSGDGFRIQAGGFDATLGYRIRIFSAL